ncbi:hypothetical protein [Romboutsia sp.]|uniref:hypothetical protein n=1 Tax=Romboutsia sp. TaxID=1965302 RepID=UPI002CE6AEC4|nr:hypothetical protein [Romboutsia sp.]HSQ87271.1 hypothetical protein [Romboutsia sp.]
MTHRKRANIKKMQDYKAEKAEVAEELGINGANSTEVNVEIAAEREPKYSNKTLTKQRNLRNEQKTAREKNYFR